MRVDKIAVAIASFGALALLEQFARRLKAWRARRQLTREVREDEEFRARLRGSLPPEMTFAWVYDLEGVVAAFADPKTGTLWVVLSATSSNELLAETTDYLEASMPMEMVARVTRWPLDVPAEAVCVRPAERAPGAGGLP